MIDKLTMSAPLGGNGDNNKLPQCLVAVSTGITGAGGHAVSIGITDAGGRASPGITQAGTDTIYVIALVVILTPHHVVTTSTQELKSIMTLAAFVLRVHVDPLLVIMLLAIVHYNGPPDNENGEDAHAGGSLQKLKTFTTMSTYNDGRKATDAFLPRR